MEDTFSQLSYSKSSLQCALWTLHQRKTLLNQPANELEGERGRQKFFLALFGPLKGDIQTLPALLQHFRG